MKKQKNLVNVEDYGFEVNNKYREDWARSGQILVRKEVAKALVKVREELPEGYNLEIHDGKRTKEDQRRIIKICEEDFKNRFPDSWNERLKKFTGGYESIEKDLPPDTHRHGGAVDLTIIDENGERLNMGGRKYNETSNLGYYENKSDLSKEEKGIRDNRRLLKRAMKKAGFKPNPEEWNHWGYPSTT